MKPIDAGCPRHQQMFVVRSLFARRTAAHGGLNSTHLDATGSQRNQFCELDGERSHVVGAGAQRACFDLNATFPLGTWCPEAWCVSRKPSTRNMKVSKERTRIVTACMGKSVGVVLVERSRSQEWLLAGHQRAGKLALLRRHSTDRGRDAEEHAEVFTSECIYHSFLFGLQISSIHMDCAINHTCVLLGCRNTRTDEDSSFVVGTVWPPILARWKLIDVCTAKQQTSNAGT